jgi:hypothetical protein
MKTLLMANNVLLAAMLGLLAVSPAAAERELLPLGKLLARADLVVVGQVAAIDGAGTPAELAAIDVRTILAGTAPDPLVVAGSPTDAEGHGFRDGEVLLLFLTSSPAPPGATHAIVDGSAGAIAVDQETAKGAVDLLAPWLAGGTPAKRLTSLLPYLTAGGPRAPAALLAAAAADFEETAPAGVNGTILVDLTCGRAEPVDRGVELWAIRMVGRLHIEDARDCLEDLVGIESGTGRVADRTAAEAAVDALVDLGGAHSVNVLQNSLAATAQQLYSRCNPASFASATLLGLGQLGLHGEVVDSTLIGTIALQIHSRTAASTAVHALGLIQDAGARTYLQRLAREHHDPLIRSQASITLARIGG